MKEIEKERVTPLPGGVREERGEEGERVEKRKSKEWVEKRESEEREGERDRK